MQTINRAAFTLVEIMLAVGLAAAAVVMSAMLVRQLLTSHTVLMRVGARADAEANGSRELRELFGRAELGTDTTRQFVGDQRSVAFPTWCDRATGWLEHCIVRVYLDHRVDSTSIEAHFDDGSDLRLQTLTGLLEFRYYGRVGEALVWNEKWNKGLIPPAGVGLVRTGGDTTVLYIGERG